MKTPLLCLILFFSFISFGQNMDNDFLIIDSLSKKAITYISKNKDSTFFYFYKIINYSTVKNYTKGSFVGYNLIANYYYDHKKYDSAFYNAKKSYSLAKKLNNTKLKGESENLLAYIHFRLNDYENSALFADKALLNGTKITNIEIISNAYLVKGNIHYVKFENNKALDYYHKIDSIAFRKENYNTALIKSLTNAGNLILRSYSAKDTSYISIGESYFLKARNVAKILDNKLEENFAISQLGKIYVQRGNYKKAISFFTTSLQYFKNNNNTREIANTYWILGIAYNQLNNLNKATYYYKKRISLYKNTPNKLEYAKAYTDYGGLLYYNKEYKKAIPIYTTGLKLLDSLKYQSLGNILAKNYELGQSFAHQKQYKNAFKYLNKAFILQDSLNNNKQDDITLELEKKYQTQKKEHQITLLKTAKELAKQQKINQRNLFITGIGIVSFAGLFFFFLYRNKQKTTKKLKELAKLKSNLFTNISHEFRTPLTLISGPIQQQLKKKQLSKTDRITFEIIQRNTTRLLALVNQLLDISKIESGTIKLNVAQHQLIPFINSLTEGFSFVAIQKGIHLKTHFPKTTIKTWFDKDIVEKIITNLLSNALKYTPKNGTISCTSNLQNNNWIFEVKNTGKGIAKNEINKIFNRFYQLNKNAEGVGIGLALVKELTLIHKGKITVESEPNKWTCFKVTIPINKNSFKTDETLNKTPISNNFKTTHFSENSITNINLNTEISKENEQPILLVVDDNKEVLTYTGSLFKKSYKILQAANGKEGIELALKYVPDIIISDVMMPIKDGIELCNTLKVDERTNHIPIILLTAKAGDENKITGIKTGADAYITKPFNNEFLQLKVTQLIAIRKKLQARYSQELILKPTDIAINSIDELFLERVQEVLDTNLVESSFHINEFCRAVGMSRMQLHRKLKVLTGLSTTEFIRSQRLKLAAQLLKTSDINISQVGYSVGFSNHAYFSKCFKKIYNCTPSEYSKY